MKMRAHVRALAILAIAVLSFRASSSTAEDSHCGRNALYWALTSLDVDVSFEELRQHFSPSGNATADEMARLAEHYGVSAEGIIVQHDQLSTFGSFLHGNKWNTKAIWAMRSNTRKRAPYHFVFVHSVDADSVSFYDVESGEMLSMDSNTLKSQMPMVAIVLTKNKNGLVIIQRRIREFLNSPYLFVVCLSIVATMQPWRRTILQWTFALMKRASVEWRRSLVLAGLVTSGFAAVVFSYRGIVPLESFVGNHKLTDAEITVSVEPIGDVPIGTAAKSKALVSNNTFEALEVHVKSVSCHCLNVQPMKLTLGPNAESSLEITIESTKIGPATQEIVLAHRKYADDAEKALVCKLGYCGVSGVELTPSSVNVGAVPSEGSWQYQIEFVSSGGHFSSLFTSASIEDAVNELDGTFNCCILRSHRGEVAVVLIEYAGGLSPGLFSFPIVLSAADGTDWVCQVNGELIGSYLEAEG